MPFKRLPLFKFPGNCESCGRRIAVGQSGWWDPDTSKVRCASEKCAPDDDRGDSDSNGPVRPPTGWQERWKQLVRHYRECVTREASGDPTDIRDRHHWMACPDLVPVLIGSVDEVHLESDAREFLDRLGPQEVVLAGYPTLVLDRRGTRRIAPLLVMEFEKGPDLTLVPADDLPYLNPAIVNDDYFDDDACVAARQILAGSALMATSFDAMIGEVLSVLGFDALAPGRISTPGVNNASCCVAAERSLMTRALLEELRTLEDRRDWGDTAAGLLFGTRQSSARWRESPVALPLAINDAQEQAVEAARWEPLVVVTGPPGTGKSQFVATAVANAWLDGDTVLVSSTNNAAVDVAVERSEGIEPLLLLRTGNRQYRERLPDSMNAIIARLPTSPPDEAQLRAEHARAHSNRNQLLTLFETVSGLELELAELALRLGQSAEALWPAGILPEVDLRQLWWRAKRLRHTWFFPGIRRRRFMRRLRVSKNTGFELMYQWVRDSVRIHEAEGELSESQAEVGDPATSLAAVEAELAQTSQAVVVVCAVGKAVRGRNALSGIATVRAGGPGFSAAISHALSAVRGWATTALSVKQNLPLSANLFDLLVVDEASQCKVAEVLPLAYRAKRIVVVGDPNQLNPVVRLDNRQLDRLTQAVGLNRAQLDRSGMDHGTGSAYFAYEHILDNEDVRLLDEHYRCHPTIARWFNTAFYGGRLHVLTNLGDLGETQRGLYWIDVEGQSERGSRGGAFNRVEADLAVSVLEDHLLSADSLGVVTPFAAQARLIRILPSGAWVVTFSERWISTPEQRTGFRAASVMSSCSPRCSRRTHPLALLGGLNSNGTCSTLPPVALRGH